MRDRVAILLLCSMFVGLAVGCTSHVGNVTIFSTRNVEMSQPHDRLPRVKESDSRLWLAFIPLGSPPSGLQAGIDMIEDQNADYLTNVEVTEGGWTLLAISMGWVTIEADPWRRSGVATPRASGEH
jgi:hypothetical protein